MSHSSIQMNGVKKWIKFPNVSEEKVVVLDALTTSVMLVMLVGHFQQIHFVVIVVCLNLKFFIHYDLECPAGTFQQGNSVQCKCKWTSVILNFIFICSM